MLYCNYPSSHSVNVFSRRSVRFAALLVFIGVSGITIGVASNSNRFGKLDTDGTVRSASRVAVLDPEEWVGKRFPLIDYVDIGTKLQQGKWEIVLYRETCPRCRELLPRLMMRSTETAAQHGNVAIIEVASVRGSRSADDFRASDPSITHGVLANTYDWFVITPLSIGLESGTVSWVKRP